MAKGESKTNMASLLCPLYAMARAVRDTVCLRLLPVGSSHLSPFLVQCSFDWRLCHDFIDNESILHHVVLLQSF